MKCLGSPWHECCGGWLVDDLRQGAIEVEEDGRASRPHHHGELAEGCQCIRQGRHSAVDIAHRHLGQIADHRVRPAFGQRGTGFAGAVNADHEAKPTRAGGGDTGFGILHDNGAGRPYSQTTSGLQQHGRIGFTRQVEFLGDDTVHPDSEKVGDTGRGEYGSTVATGREHRDGHTRVGQSPHQRDRGLEDGYAGGDL